MITIEMIFDGGVDILGFWTEEEAAHVPHEWTKQGVDCNLHIVKMVLVMLMRLMVMMLMVHMNGPMILFKNYKP